VSSYQMCSVDVRVAKVAIQNGFPVFGFNLVDR
jgi:hypothetical protein